MKTERSAIAQSQLSVKLCEDVFFLSDYRTVGSTNRRSVRLTDCPVGLSECRIIATNLTQWRSTMHVSFL